MTTLKPFYGPRRALRLRRYNSLSWLRISTYMKHSKILNLMLASAVICGTGIPAFGQGNGANPSAPQATKSNTLKPYHKTKKATHKAYNKTKEGSHAAADRTKEGAQTAADRTKEGAQSVYAPNQEQHTRARDNAHRSAIRRHDRRSEQRQKANDQANPQ